MSPPRSSFYTPGRRVAHQNSHIYIDHCYVQHYAPSLPHPDAASSPSLASPPPALNTSLTSPSPTSLSATVALASPPPKPKIPILFIHGGGLTGAQWDATPDGRPSWAQRAAQAGHDVFALDAVDSGRSARAPEWAREGESEHRTAREVWTRFRFGPDTEEAYARKEGWDDGVGQFGLIGAGEDGVEEGKSNAGGEEGRRKREVWFENLVRGQSARRRNTDVVEARGIRDAIGMIGRCWLVAHSHGAALTLLAMRMDEEHVETESELRGSTLLGTDIRLPGEGVRMRDLVERVVLVEPPGPPPDQPLWGKQPASVKGLMVWGDYLKGHKIWDLVVKGYMRDGTAEHWLLPERGIKGNSHFPMCDKNSDVVWAEIYGWLAGE
ncbi:MAG: hypothetical protein Q9165_001086 [Trypethelium subeluteriae]